MRAWALRVLPIGFGPGLTFMGQPVGGQIVDRQLWRPIKVNPGPSPIGKNRRPRKTCPAALVRRTRVVKRRGDRVNCPRIERFANSDMILFQWIDFYGLRELKVKLLIANFCVP